MYHVLHKAETRGKANLGWLDSKHTFSFSRYYNPERMNFGLLRVLNDDIIKGGGGFGTHPHDNMEIVSIPIVGALEHKDSLGNSSVILENDVQIMSAGSGIKHSEFNHYADKETNFLQIWIFPKVANIEPRYEQKTFEKYDRYNRFQFVVSPTHPEAVWINQDAFFSLGNLQKDFSTAYEIQKTGNILYAFVIEGKVKIEGIELEKRDGLGLGDVANVQITATENAEVLLIEVPNM